MKTLYIHSSPRSEEQSISSLALKLFMENDNSDERIILNLNKEEIGSRNLTSENFQEFFSNGISDKYIEQLFNVDKVVIATAMTNFNYTATLKNYLDHILVANKTFKYKYDGKGTSEGLLKHLKVQLILTQGAPTGWYNFASHAEALKGTWEFAGATVTKPILLDGTKAPENIQKTSKEYLENYNEQIIKAAKEF